MGELTEQDQRPEDGEQPHVKVASEEDSTMCGLYHTEKVKHMLKSAVCIALGKEAVVPQDLASVDMLHYLGTDTLADFASNVMGLCPPPPLPSTGQPVIVDVGAGVGGPARFLAHDYGCRVLALEYNKELCRAGELLNRLVLRDPSCVRFVHGDVCAATKRRPELLEVADAFVSQLCFLHIADKASVFRECAAMLKPGGLFMIEDFCLRRRVQPQPKHEEADGRAPLAASCWKKEADILERCIQVPCADGLLTANEYVAALEQAGLEVTVVEDRTEEWANFVWARLEAFLTEHSCPTPEASGGQEHLYVSVMQDFYTQVARVFALPFYRHQSTCSPTARPWAEEFPHIAHRGDVDLSHVDPTAGPVTGGVYIVGRKRWAPVTLEEK